MNKQETNKTHAFTSIQLHVLKHPSLKVINFRFLLSCDTIDSGRPSLSKDPVENVYSILAQSIWNNCHTKANGKSLYNKVIMNKGIYNIADLVDKNGSFKPWERVSLELLLEPVEFVHL